MTVLRIDAEGGSITLARMGTQFIVYTGEMTLEEEGEEDFSSAKYGPVPTLEEALLLLHRYPWTKLFPLEIDPQFRDQIWSAVQARHAGNERWRRLCFPEK